MPHQDRIPTSSIRWNKWAIFLHSEQQKTNQETLWWQDPTKTLSKTSLSLSINPIIMDLIIPSPFAAWIYIFYPLLIFGTILTFWHCTNVLWNRGPSSNVEVRHSSHLEPTPPQTFQLRLDQLESWNLAQKLTTPIWLRWPNKPNLISVT